MARDMLTIVIDQEKEGKKEFFTKLGKLKKLVDGLWDQANEGKKPSFMEIHEAFQELEDAYAIWQTYKAALDIFHDE